MGRVLPCAVPMGRGEGRELPCIGPMGRRGGGEGTPICRPYGEVGEGIAFLYTDPRGRGGHSHIQTLGEKGEGRALPYTDPWARRGGGYGTPICIPYGEGEGRAFI